MICISCSLNAWSRAWNTMYMLRSKSMNYVSAYPRIHFNLLRLFLGEGWSSPLRIRVSAYPRIRVSASNYTLRFFLGEGLSLPLRIHFMKKITLKLFLGKGWPSPLRIHTLQKSAFEVAGYSAVTPTFSWSTEIQFKRLTNLTKIAPLGKVNKVCMYVTRFMR